MKGIGRTQVELCFRPKQEAVQTSSALRGNFSSRLVRIRFRFGSDLIRACGQVRRGQREF